MPTAFIVCSHLRWNRVFQRSQHLLARLARQHREYFVEEPVHDDRPARRRRRPRPRAARAVGAA